MKAGSRRAVWAAAVISSLVLVAGTMSSYIDGNSGSYIFQLIVGAFAGGLMAIGVFWRRIRAAVGRLFSRKG
ncbi:MAG: hypothetical protein ACRDKS_13615 [Actinomycetota bacterium]